MSEDVLKLFEFHGVELQKNGSQAKGDCAFCGKENKFFVNQKTGQWDCKVCSRKGNKFGFLSELAKDKELSDSDVKFVQSKRGTFFSREFLQEKGIWVDEDCIFFPITKPKKKNLVNLRKWSAYANKIYNSPGLSSLYYAKYDESSPIFLCEGEFDALALEVLFKRAKVDFDYSICAAPGANVFKDQWVQAFEGREVFILYDNDEAGKNGSQKVLDIIAGHAASAKVLNWSEIDEELPDKYDIRDYVTEACKKKKCKRYARLLIDACQEVQIQGGKAVVPALKRESFKEVLVDWQNVYEFNQSSEDVLAACLAILVSLVIGDRKDPLWLFIKAPASTGKTSILETFKAIPDLVEFIAELTPAALVTGLKQDDDDYDPSLLSRANNKIWVIEDFTPILEMPGKEEVFGIFRAAYNGFYHAHFAKFQRDYEDLNFAIIAGVTPAIERVSLGDLGERFLRIGLLDENFNEDAHIEKALKNVGVRQEQKNLLMGGIKGFVQYLLKDPKVPKFDEAMHAKIINLAKFAALMRTAVHTDRDALMVRPVTEVGSRIATQLKKFGIALGCVYQRDEVDDECYRVMQKVAFDSSIGYNLEVVQWLSKLGNLDIPTLAAKLRMSEAHTRKICDKALAVGIIDYQGGKRNRVVSISQDVKAIMRKGEIKFTKGVKTIKSSRRKKRHA